VLAFTFPITVQPPNASLVHVAGVAAIEQL